MPLDRDFVPKCLWSSALARFCDDSMVVPVDVVERVLFGARKIMGSAEYDKAVRVARVVEAALPLRARLLVVVPRVVSTGVSLALTAAQSLLVA